MPNLLYTLYIHYVASCTTTGVTYGFLSGLNSILIHPELQIITPLERIKYITSKSLKIGSCCLILSIGAPIIIPILLITNKINYNYKVFLPIFMPLLLFP